MRTCTSNATTAVDHNPEPSQNGDFDGYQLWADGPRPFVDELVARAHLAQPTLAFYLNAHTYNLAASDNTYRQLLDQADLLYPDGISIVLAARLAGARRLTRMTAGDFFNVFCRRCEQAGLKLYVVASRPHAIDRACRNLQTLFPLLNIVGRHHGYVNGDNSQRTRLLADIQHARPDVLLIGMGSPQQEAFALDCQTQLPVPVIWTLGALFDYYAGTERLAPRWLGRCGFEWLYRLIQNPAGKWRRYTLGNARFIARAARAALRKRMG